MKKMLEWKGRRYSKDSKWDQIGLDKKGNNEPTDNIKPGYFYLMLFSQ